MALRCVYDQLSPVDAEGLLVMGATVLRTMTMTVMRQSGWWNDAHTW